MTIQQKAVAEPGSINGLEKQLHYDRAIQLAGLFVGDDVLGDRDGLAKLAIPFLG